MPKNSVSKAIASLTIRSYCSLTKPGIILGNVVTATGGFFLASTQTVNLWLLLATILGLSCIIASSCVFNNTIDRAIDSKMERTKTRALATNSISLHYALIFALSLGLLGSAVFFQFTNLLALKLALFGSFVYVIPYSFSKYYSTHSTLIGSVAGALPPVIGYCAVSNQFDTGAILLFAILVTWQMPHFLAISIRRMQDYIAASIPILPVKKGIFATKFQMFVYVAAFFCIAPLLFVFGFAGILYFFLSVLLGLFWVFLSIRGFFSDNDQAWAKHMYIYSLIIITALNMMIVIDHFI